MARLTTDMQESARLIIAVRAPSLLRRPPRGPRPWAVHSDRKRHAANSGNIRGSERRAPPYTSRPSRLVQSFFCSSPRPRLSPTSRPSSALSRNLIQSLEYTSRRWRDSAISSTKETFYVFPPATNTRRLAAPHAVRNYAGRRHRPRTLPTLTGDPDRLYVCALGTHHNHSPTSLVARVWSRTGR